MKPFLLFCLLGFIGGSIPTAYWTARRLRGIDIRQHGSGNAGATNAMRVLGKGPGYFVFAIDFLKGFLPVMIYRAYEGAPPDVRLLTIGIGAVLGHVFSPWLGFKGGKGVATAAGMLAAALPANFLIGLASWLGFYFTTRMVSISSLIAALNLLLSAVALRQDSSVIGILSGLLGFVLWTHRSNISRLINKKENKF